MNRELQWRMTDNFKRKFYLKYEIKTLILRSLIKNSYLPWTHRYCSLYNKSKTMRWASLTQQKNKCVKTGRVWSTIKLTRYSRFVFRNESYQGNLPGFKRASW